jgi:hypothetical protein
MGRKTKLKNLSAFFPQMKPVQMLQGLALREWFAAGRSGFNPDNTKLNSVTERQS